MISVDSGGSQMRPRHPPRQNATVFIKYDLNVTIR